MGPDKSYAEKEKLGRGRWVPRDGSKMARLGNLVGRISHKTRLRLLGLLAIIVMIILFYSTRKHYPENRFQGYL
jgi:mannan polymerase II complex MNN10 subunit